MTVVNAPPGRASTVIWSSGALTPIGPQKWVRCSGSTMQSKTSCRGASKTRVTCRTCSGTGVSFVGGVQGAEVVVELVEALGPPAPVRLDPVHGGVQGVPFQVAGAELRLPTSGDQPRAFEHLQVLGYPRQAQVEGLGQLVHRGVAGRELGHDGPAGRVGERRERGIEPLLDRGRHDASRSAVMDVLNPLAI